LKQGGIEGVYPLLARLEKYVHKLPGRLDDVLGKWNAAKDRIFVRLTGQASHNRIETALQNKLGDPDIAFRQKLRFEPDLHRGRGLHRSR